MYFLPGKEMQGRQKVRFWLNKTTFLSTVQTLPCPSDTTKRKARNEKEKEKMWGTYKEYTYDTHLFNFIHELGNTITTPTLVLAKAQTVHNPASKEKQAIGGHSITNGSKSPQKHEHKIHPICISEYHTTPRFSPLLLFIVHFCLSFFTPFFFLFKL